MIRADKDSEEVKQAEPEDSLALHADKNGQVSFYSDKSLSLFDDRRSIDGIYRIKTNLLKELSLDNEAVMIAGGHNGAGCTTISVNLGSVLAKSCTGKILLVDSNFQKPDLTNAFKADSMPGFYELIKGEAAIEDVILSTDISNLYFIGVGGSSGNRFDINTAQINNLLIQLRKQFFLTLFDSQPLEPHPEAIFIAGVIKNVLLVIESETSRNETVENNRKLVENAGGKIIGAALNRRRLYIPSWLYNRL